MSGLPLLLKGASFLVGVRGRSFRDVFSLSLRFWGDMREKGMFFMNTDELREKKLKMWRKKFEEAEVELREIIERRSEAAAMGDLRENAAFLMADEDVATQRVRIEELKKIIAKLENPSPAKVLGGKGE